MKASFGGKRPYNLDTEISDELSPDPYSEEPLPHSEPHIRRRLSKTAKPENKREQEIK